MSERPRPQLKDEAAAHIRELIISGQAGSGELLRLSPLADRIGASVTPVREALLLLAQDGWVRQEPNRGFRIAEISAADINDAYLVQAMVAGELAARAAALIDDAQLDALRRKNQQIQEHADDDPGYLEEANHDIHLLIYAAAGSERLVWFVEAASRFVPRRFWGLIPGWIEHNRTGHEPIIDALAAHDSDAARTAMSAHIRAAEQLLLVHLDGMGFWTDGQKADAPDPAAPV